MNNNEKYNKCFKTLHAQFALIPAQQPQVSSGVYAGKCVSMFL